jgi:1-acyl-sn-glycerol-3-phosphate acyltransferase
MVSCKNPDRVEDPALSRFHLSSATPKGVVFKKPDTGLFSKYPIDRGILGSVAYHVAVGASRMLLDMKASGLENIPKKPPFILCPNHETYLDGMWVASYLPRGQFAKLCSLAAQELITRHGAFGQLMLRVGRGIPVDRLGNPVRALILAKQQLEKGEIVLVHPEGTRTSDGNLGEFMDGAAYLAVKSGAPIVPVYIEGGYRIFNRHMKWPKSFDWKRLRRMTLRLTFGRPMRPCDFQSVKEMTEGLSLWMKDMQGRRFCPAT